MRLAFALRSVAPRLAVLPTQVLKRNLAAAAATNTYGIPSASTLFEQDEQLRAKVPQTLRAKYEVLANDAALQRTVKSLEARNHIVSVVENGAAALKIIKESIPKGSDVTSVGSTTLREIGYIEHSMSSSDWVDVRGLMYANKDPSKTREIVGRRLTALYSLGSASAVSETGEIVIVDASGTRIAPHLTTNKVILVVGLNKITPTYEAAVQRTRQYAYEVESARCRDTYKIPGSTLANFFVFQQSSPDNKRIHVILVKELLGY